jgi:hypothetical protein
MENDMKATVVEILHPNEHLNPRIYVQVQRVSHLDTIDTYRQTELYDDLKVGDPIEVKRIVNSPYVYVEGHYLL